MKRIVVMLAAAMLMAAPAFAAQSASTVYKGTQQSNGATVMEGNINQTTVKDVTAINSGKDNKINIGGQKASNGAQMKGNIDQTTVKGSTIINSGKGNEVNIGGQTAN